jgi:hypothetical protein
MAQFSVKIMRLTGSVLVENQQLDLEKSERIAQIRADHEKRVERAKAKRKVDPLRPEQGPVDLDEIYGQQKVCLACHK